MGVSNRLNMKGNDDLEHYSKNRKEIEKYLATHSPLSVNQIAEALKLSWATVQSHLDTMEASARVHFQQLSKTKVYYLNGVGKWQNRVKLNDSTYLFLDTFISPFGEPFIRIKETTNKSGNWEKFGEVMVTKDKIDDVIKFLENVKGDIDKYYKAKEEVIAKTK